MVVTTSELSNDIIKNIIFQKTRVYELYPNIYKLLIAIRHGNYFEYVTGDIIEKKINATILINGHMCTYFI